MSNLSSPSATLATTRELNALSASADHATVSAILDRLRTEQQRDQQRWEREITDLRTKVIQSTPPPASLVTSEVTVSSESSVSRTSKATTATVTSTSGMLSPPKSRNKMKPLSPNPSVAALPTSSQVLPDLALVSDSQNSKSDSASTQSSDLQAMQKELEVQRALLAQQKSQMQLHMQQQKQQPQPTQQQQQHLQQPESKATDLNTSQTSDSAVPPVNTPAYIAYLRDQLAAQQAQQRALEKALAERKRAQQLHLQQQPVLPLTPSSPASVKLFESATKDVTAPAVVLTAPSSAAPSPAPAPVVAPTAQPTLSNSNSASNLATADDKARLQRRVEFLQRTLEEQEKSATLMRQQTTAELAIVEEERDSLRRQLRASETRRLELERRITASESALLALRESSQNELAQARVDSDRKLMEVSAAHQAAMESAQQQWNANTHATFGTLRSQVDELNVALAQLGARLHSESAGRVAAMQRIASLEQFIQEISQSKQASAVTVAPAAPTSTPAIVPAPQAVTTVSETASAQPSLQLKPSRQEQQKHQPKHEEVAAPTAEKVETVSDCGTPLEGNSDDEDEMDSRDLAPSAVKSEHINAIAPTPSKKAVASHSSHSIDMSRIAAPTFASVVKHLDDSAAHALLASARSSSVHSPSRKNATVNERVKQSPLMHVAWVAPTNAAVSAGVARPTLSSALKARDLDDEPATTSTHAAPLTEAQQRRLMAPTIASQCRLHSADSGGVALNFESTLRSASTEARGRSRSAEPTQRRRRSISLSSQAPSQPSVPASPTKAAISKGADLVSHPSFARSALLAAQLASSQSHQSNLAFEEFVKQHAAAASSLLAEQPKKSKKKVAEKSTSEAAVATKVVKKVKKAVDPAKKQRKVEAAAGAALLYYYQQQAAKDAAALATSVKPAVIEVPSVPIHSEQSTDALSQLQAHLTQQGVSARPLDREDLISLLSWQPDVSTASTVSAVSQVKTVNKARPATARK